jgi:hypothetical protein
LQGACVAPSTLRYRIGASELAWIDACELPGAARVLRAPATYTEPIAMPFPFVFYGATVTSFALDATGVLQFGERASAADGPRLPSRAAPRPAVFAVTSGEMGHESAQVCVAFEAARRAVIEYRGVRLGRFGESTFDLEVVLDAPTGDVHLRYRGDALRPTIGSLATVGLQDATGTAATVYARRVTGALWSGLGLRFSPVPPR